MKNVRAKLALAVVICAAMTAVSLCGCGSSGTASLSDPMAFYQKARENVQTADSFRMSGEMVMEFNDVPDAETMAIEYDMVYEQKSDGETLAKMDMRVAGSQGFDVEAYITESRMYMEMPGGMWVYEELDLTSDLAEMSQGMGPQYVMDMLDMAESAEVVAEDADTVTYDLVLDFDKLMAEQGEEMERTLEELEEEGIPGIDEEEFMDFMRDIFSNMQMQMTVDKNSGLATHFQMYMEMDLSSLSTLIPGNPLPQGATMTMDADFTIGEYGKSFGISLPEETRDAIPIDEMESLVDA